MSDNLRLILYWEFNDPPLFYIVIMIYQHAIKALMCAEFYLTSDTMMKPSDSINYFPQSKTESVELLHIPSPY